MYTYIHTLKGYLSEHTHQRHLEHAACHRYQIKEVHSANLLTANASLSSVFCRALGKDVAECPKNTRQTFFSKKNKKDTPTPRPHHQHRHHHPRRRHHVGEEGRAPPRRTTTIHATATTPGKKGGPHHAAPPLRHQQSRLLEPLATATSSSTRAPTPPHRIYTLSPSPSLDPVVLDLDPPLADATAWICRQRTSPH